MIIETLGAAIRERRRDLRLTQDEIAALAGCSPRFIRSWAPGSKKRPPCQPTRGPLANPSTTNATATDAATTIRPTRTVETNAPTASVATAHAAARTQLHSLATRIAPSPSCRDGLPVRSAPSSDPRCCPTAAMGSPAPAGPPAHRCMIVHQPIVGRARSRYDARSCTQRPRSPGSEQSCVGFGSAKACAKTSSHSRRASRRARSMPSRPASRRRVSTASFASWMRSVNGS